MPWTNPRIKIGRGAVRINQTMVREATAIGRDPRRRVAEAKRNPARRSGPATNQNPNNRTTKVDPHRKTMTARRKRRNRRARQKLYSQLTRFFKLFVKFNKLPVFIAMYWYSKKYIQIHDIYIELLSRMVIRAR